MTETVIALAQAMGSVDKSQLDLLGSMAEVAVKSLTARLRDGVTEADCGQAFPVAAAWIALAGLSICSARDDISAFTAGDLSIKSEGGYAKAGYLRREAERLMAPYLRDDRFRFQRVSSR